MLPLDDRRQELFNPKLAGRPDLMFGRKSLTLYEGMNGLLENDFINVKNTSFEIVAEMETGDKPVNGVIVAQGGRFGGWSLYVKEGTPIFMYNYLGLDRYTATGTAKLPKGKSTVKMDFAYDGRQAGCGRDGDPVHQRQVRGLDQDREDRVRRLLGRRNGRVSASTRKPPYPKTTTARAASSRAPSTRSTISLKK